MTEIRLIDLAAKKAEGKWIKVLDRFWLSATPEMFKWLGWVAALAALTYVAQKNGGWPVRRLLNFYYVAMFFQFTFMNPPLMKSTRGRHFVSLVISGLLAAGTALLAQAAVNIVASAKP
jgi:hypothetical protein